jgi:hypothetical protein
MPNRILKDSICTSPNIDRLSRDAEVFFYRLIVQCDDFGRMDARLPILRAKCYPLQIDKTSEGDVGRWLAELVRCELVTLYTVTGQAYLQMRTWERHQQVRAKRSKYPDMIAHEINCNQLQSNVPENPIQSNPIQSESNPVTAPESATQAPEPTKDERTDGDITQAIAAKLESVGIGLTQYVIDTYVAAAQDNGIHAVLAGITAAAEQGKQQKMSYVLACIRNKAQGDSRQNGKPHANGDSVTPDKEAALRTRQAIEREAAKTSERFGATPTPKPMKREAFAL